MLYAMETSFTTPTNRMKLDTIQQQEKDQSSAYFGSPAENKHHASKIQS